MDILDEASLKYDGAEGLDYMEEEDTVVSNGLASHAYASNNTSFTMQDDIGPYVPQQQREPTPEPPEPATSTKLQFW
jgi:hypothetical protein